MQQPPFNQGQPQQGQGRQPPPSQSLSGAQYPPQQQWGQQPPPQQQWTQYPPQQPYPSQPGMPLYPQYPGYQPQPGQYAYPQLQTPISGTRQPKKKHGPWFWILIAFGILIVFSVSVGISQATNQSGSVSNISADTPVPTLSPAQVEKAYKATTRSITVDNLDKDGNHDKGKDVYFTCKILKFVKDDSGNTAGANVQAPGPYSPSVIQIAFPSSTDITQLNEGDILEVWGTDRGVFSGQNAFGGTVQEVGIAARYITDKTTNYQTS